MREIARFFKKREIGTRFGQASRRTGVNGGGETGGNIAGGGEIRGVWRYAEVALSLAARLREFELISENAQVLTANKAGKRESGNGDNSAAAVEFGEFDRTREVR